MKNANGFDLDLGIFTISVFNQFMFDTINNCIKPNSGYRINKDLEEGHFTVSVFSPLDDADIVLEVIVCERIAVIWTICRHDGLGDNLVTDIDDQESFQTLLWGDCENPTLSQVQSVFTRIGNRIIKEFDDIVATDKARYNQMLETQASQLGTTRTEIDEVMRRQLH